jgi:integrase
MVLGMARPWKHPKTGVYWFRKVVPATLRKVIGKTEERRSLRTKDPRIAALRHPQVAAEVAAEWEALQNRPAAPPFRYARHKNPQDRYEEALTAAGYVDERDAPEDWEPPPEARITEPSPPADRSVFSLTGMLDGWWTEARATGRKPSTYESYRNTVAGLVTFLGYDDAKQVTPEDVVRFKDHRLASTNPRTGKPISAKTVKDSDLAGLKTLFGWAVSNRKLTSNPATGITIKLGKPQRLRGKGSTDEEAKALLRASLNVQRGAESAGTYAAKLWVPILAIYTGARVGELAQLRRQDVRQEGGHWIIELTPEAGTIKTNEARKVVLHPHLIELGFPAFVEAAPIGHLFLKVGPKGDVLGPLQGVKNRLSEFARTVVTDPNVAPMHGLRHRFKTVGMEAGVPTRVLDAIQGHSPRTAAEGYGEVTIRTMAAAMERIPRVDVGVLPAEAPTRSLLS